MVTRKLLMKFAVRFGITEKQLQVYSADALQYNTSMRFDVVLGNPPFNPPVEKGDGKGNGSGNKIWHKFIERAFEFADDNGHLLFVTPHNWRQGTFKARSQHRKAQQLMFANRIEWWLDARAPVDHFSSVGSANNIDAWHVIKGRKSELPEVLQELRLLPKSSDSVTLTKLAKFYEVCTQEESLVWHNCDGSGRALRDLESRKAGDAEHTFRVANTSAQVRKGLYHWASDKRLTHNLRKVLVCASGQHVIGYDDGTMAVGRQTGAYIVGSEQEGARLIEFLRSPLVNFIASQFLPNHAVTDDGTVNAFGFPMELFERVPKTILTKPWEEVFKATETT